MFRRLFSILDPNTRRRLRRFGKIKRAKWSLLLLLLIFLLSLFANFIANEKPWLVKVNGRLLFPIFSYYSEDALTGSGRGTRPNYKEIEKSPLFAENKKNWMLWTIVPYGPRENLRASDIQIDETLTIRFAKAARVATLDFDSKLIIQRSRGAAGFYGVGSDRDVRKKPIETGNVVLPPELKSAIARRFANQKSDELTVQSGPLEISLSSFTPKSRPPKYLRLSLKEAATAGSVQEAVMKADLTFENGEPPIWSDLTESEKERIIEQGKLAMEVQTEPLKLETKAGRLIVSFDRETVSFPFRPVKSHRLGLDESGRDVFVCIFHATRVSLLFGISLVVLSYILGTFLGAVQGYFGGLMDIVGQRLTEIWSSLPFLFIMILLSSVYGRGFFLLLFVSALFWWIGISLYMRAEFLRLRKQPFVESARVMGISRWKIMFRSILPNALVPVITFFPFSLVGAIFALTSLDFLGFGLPPGTSSWGDLLNQGKVHPKAWWLVLFPSIALFIVSLLGIFVGEGVRAAFDPRNESKLD